MIRKEPFILNIGQDKFKTKYDLSETKTLYRTSKRDYTVLNIATKEICALKYVSSKKSDFFDTVRKELNVIV